jgi:hypothetical protein
MLLEERRGGLIEKKVATLQAGYLLGAFNGRVLQEPASLARRLVQAGLVEEKCRLTLAEMIRGDFARCWTSWPACQRKLPILSGPMLMSALRLSKATRVSQEEFTEITR